jgi:iron complex transport system permease protein
VNTKSTFSGSRFAKTVVIVLLITSVALLCLGISIGSAGWVSPVDAIKALFGSAQQADFSIQVVRDIRLPRTIGAWLAGALLGFSGALAQGLFRNPLADPYLLGSASGASLGVAIALVASGSGVATVDWFLRLSMTGAAFVGALLAVMLTMLLAHGLGHTLRLLLAGVVVGVVLGAATSLVALMSPDILQAMQSFSLGSTAFVGWESCALMLVALVLCTTMGFVLSKALDGLTLGEHAAQSLGFNLPIIRTVLVLTLALATASAVAQTGLIAFVGLAAPHVVRALVKVPSRTLLILSTLMGAVLLTSADVLARGLIAPLELPVGIVTALLGGAYLLFLMHKQKSAVTHAARNSK